MDQLTMKQRIASFDWSATPLGPMAGWPQSLRAAVTTLLASPYPMVLLWGPELLQIYNDAYAEVIGDKHPAALGMPGLDGFGLLQRLREESAEARSEMEMAERLLERERAARAEAERVNRLKDEFLSTVSHELRTPLNAILGWAQLLRQPGVDAARLVEGIGVIERNARSQAKLTEDLLDLGRIVSGKVRLDLQPTDLVAVVREAVETLQPTAELKKVRLDKSLELEAGLAAADPNRLHQVIANLLSNAIKFTPKGGRVLATLKRVASSYEIAVSDTGVGIDPDFLPYLFERFRQADGSTTRRYGGLGIGLSIVKSLVELHGGTIKARSEGRNRGATFVVTLPVAAIRGGEAEASPRPPAEAPAPLASVKVLVVDDEPVAREVVRQALQSRGAQVVTAGSGEEALRLFLEIRPDILVSDIGMPVVDGCELLRRVRSLGPVGAVPAVALTATAEVEDCPGLLLAGYQACLAKPVDPAELVSTVAGLVGLKGLAFS